MTRSFRHSAEQRSTRTDQDRTVLEHVPDAIRDLDAGRIAGKAAVVVPSARDRRFAWSDGFRRFA